MNAGLGQLLFLTAAPDQIARMRVMTPNMRLFQRAPVLLEKLYTQGETATQMPMSPISHSCHIVVTPLARFVSNDTLHLYGG